MQEEMKRKLANLISFAQISPSVILLQNEISI
jgi:hypothetical protein